MELEPNAQYVRRVSLFDYEAAYKHWRGDDALIELNDIDFERPDHSEQLMRLTHSRSSGTDFIARCECGDMTGTHYRGQTCPKCHTKVLDDLDDATGEFPMRVWIRTPSNLEHGWLHPIIYQMLKGFTKYAGKKNSDQTYIDDLLNTAVKKKDLPSLLQPFANDRGFNGLYRRWNDFLEAVFNDPKLIKRQKAKLRIAEIKQVLKDNANCIWVKHQPILFNSLHAIILDGDDDSRKCYTDKSGRHISQIASSLSYMESQGDDITEDMFNRMVYGTYQGMIEYLFHITRNMIDRKTGLTRQHVFGARHHWSMRAVITPIVGPHDLDELYAPWVGLVQMLRDHIVGRLMFEYNMHPSAAYERQQGAMMRYDPLIHELMNRFIEESPSREGRQRGGGIPVLFGRNPSVDAGSLGTFFISKVKTDIHDKTISCSVLSTSRPNADFDGDEMTAIYIVENDAVHHFMVKHPSHLYLSRDNPEVANHYGIPKPLAIVANSYLGEI